ncbi:LysR family transcriptional regulator [Qipengyuania sp. GH25]|uniref:LysR family transcriptional regulator n=1 Tax=Qipengyuania pacifica TaxID=2860199 RepID=A0ABS7JK59_9SPHN|nr:LysR family transcriptional regulator [Qipengyuania aerophila]
MARHGGFRAAARATGLSPSALSHAVANLERRLDAQLFLRSNRAVSLTDAGTRFLNELEPALERIGRAVESISDASATASGTIRMNASSVAVEQLMDDFIAPFLRENPAIDLDVHEDTALIDIAEHGFDCGLRLLELVPLEMVAVPVGPERQQHIVVGAPGYLDNMAPPASPNDLSMHECIQFRMSADTMYRWEFSKQGESFSLRTSGRVCVSSTKLALAAARNGLGLAYVTRSIANDDLETGRVIQVLEDWTPPYPGLAIYYPRNRHRSSTMRAFVEYLRERQRL